MRRSWLVGAVVALAACGSTTSARPAASTIQPAASTIQPVASTIQPVASTIQPVASTIQPVASTIQPVASTIRPAAFPITIGKVTIPTRPGRIVSLSPTATEMLFAMGAGTQVVAVDDQSNYPQEAPKTSLSGFQPNVEAIAAKNPDLVVVSNDMNGVVAGLSSLSIPVLVEPAAASLDEAYAQVTELGRATGNVAGSGDEVSSMKRRLAEVVARLAPRKGMRYYHELDNTYFTATSKTFIGALYALAGLENIADAADKTGSGYPQLSAELVVAANPAIIFLADTKCCQQTPKTVASRPGWSRIDAVRSGRVIPLDDDVASRWGPRTPELLVAVADALDASAKA